MRQRRDLILAGHHAPIVRCFQRMDERGSADTVPTAVGEPVGRPLHPLLDGHHLARGEALTAAAVLTEPHHHWRSCHPTHHGAELLGTVRVPMHEPGEVLAREGRVLIGHRPQRNLRLGQDALAVPARNIPMLGRTLGILAARLTTHPRRPNLALRLQLDTLRRQCAMVDPDIMAQLGAALVDVIGPALAPAGQLGRSVPLPHLLAEALRPDFAHRQHHMRVRLRLPLRIMIPMHVEIRHHAAVDELGLHEVAGELHAIVAVQLARQGELHLTGELRILAFLRGLDLVPQCRAIGKPRRCPLRSQDLGMNHARLGGEVVGAAEPIVMQL